MIRRCGGWAFGCCSRGCFSVVGCSWTDGTDKLRVAVNHRCTTFLWYRFRSWLFLRLSVYSVDGLGNIYFTDHRLSMVSQKVLLRSVGVDLAYTDLRALFSDDGIKKKRSQIILTPLAMQRFLFLRFRMGLDLRR